MIEGLIAEAKEQATWDIPESTQILLLKLAAALEQGNCVEIKAESKEFNDIVVMEILDTLGGISNMLYQENKYAYPASAIKMMHCSRTMDILSKTMKKQLIERKRKAGADNG